MAMFTTAQLPTVSLDQSGRVKVLPTGAPGAAHTIKPKKPRRRRVR